MLTKEEIKQYKIDPLISLCFDYIYPITFDRLLATHGREISLIDSTGFMICTYDSIEIPFYYDTNDYELVEGDQGSEYVAKQKSIDKILKILDNGLWGLMDYDGDIILEPTYRILNFVGENEMECLI